jgi:hypothetical protein
MPQTERVVIANLTQCYHCQRLIDPQDGVRRRQVVTGGAIGRTRWLLLPFLSFPTREAHFEWVALCPACARAYDAQEHAEQVHNGKKFAFWFGSLLVIVFACTLGVPWWVAVPLAAVCTYYGVLWEVILVWLGVSAVLHFGAHWDAEDHPWLSLPLFAGAIGVVLWAKSVARRRRAALVPQEERP